MIASITRRAKRTRTSYLSYRSHTNYLILKSNFDYITPLRVIDFRNVTLRENINCVIFFEASATRLAVDEIDRGANFRLRRRECVIVRHMSNRGQRQRKRRRVGGSRAGAPGTSIFPCFPFLSCLVTLWCSSSRHSTSSLQKSPAHCRSQQSVFATFFQLYFP